MERDPIWCEADIRRIIAMNDDMFRAGYISQKIHDAIYDKQVRKLTSICGNDIIAHSEMLNYNQRGTHDAIIYN